jgi:hypothetical protein
MEAPRRSSLRDEAALPRVLHRRSSGRGETVLPERTTDLVPHEPSLGQGAVSDQRHGEKAGACIRGGCLVCLRDADGWTAGAACGGPLSTKASCSVLGAAWSVVSQSEASKRVLVSCGTALTAPIFKSALQSLALEKTGSHDAHPDARPGDQSQQAKQWSESAAYFALERLAESDICRLSYSRLLTLQLVPSVVS